MVATADLGLPSGSGAPALSAIVAYLATNIETLDYIARVIAAGGALTRGEINAVDEFVGKGKRDGWFVKGVDCCPALGGALTPALVKLKSPSGVASSLSNTNFVAGDWDAAYGFRLTANTNKTLGTGIVPSDQGLSSTNFSLGILVTDTENDVNQPYVLGMNTSGANSALLVNNVAMAVGAGSMPSAWYGSGARVVSFGSAGWKGWVEGVRMNVSSTPITATMAAEIVLFKIGQTGSPLWGTGGVGFYFIGSELTAAEGLSLARALVQFRDAVFRPLKTRRVCVAFGDSITAGQGSTNTKTAWPTKVARALGADLSNVSQPSSQVRADAGTTTAAITRYQDVQFLRPDTVLVMYGTNDEGADGATDGTGASATDLQSKLTTIINYFKVRGAQVIVFSPPANTAHNATKQSLYVAAVAAAAATAGVPFVDVYNTFVDTGNVAGLLADTTHPLDAGQDLISALGVAYAVKGQLYPSIILPDSNSDAASSIPADIDTVQIRAITTDANDWAVLPSLATARVGKRIKGYSAVAHELRTPASSNEKINDVDSDGTQEAAIPATTFWEVEATTNGWILRASTKLGAPITAIVPD